MVFLLCCLVIVERQDEQFMGTRLPLEIFWIAVSLSQEGYPDQTFCSVLTFLPLVPGISGMELLDCALLCRPSEQVVDFLIGSLLELLVPPPHTKERLRRPRADDLVSLPK